MLVKINGRILPRVRVSVVYTTRTDFTLCLANKVANSAVNALPRVVGLMAAVPVDDPHKPKQIPTMWPLIERMQDFGLIVGICFGLWGLYMVIIGNPEGKNKIIQALLGFVGLYVIPEAFLAIRETMRH